jgi:hypothetical protein
MGIGMKRCSNLATGDSDHVTITSPKLAFGAVGMCAIAPAMAGGGISQDRFREPPLRVPNREAETVEDEWVGAGLDRSNATGVAASRHSPRDSPAKEASSPPG